MKKNHHPIYHLGKMYDAMILFKAASIKYYKDSHQYSCKIRARFMQDSGNTILFAILYCGQLANIILYHKGMCFKRILYTICAVLYYLHYFSCFRVFVIDIFWWAPKIMEKLPETALMEGKLCRFYSSSFFLSEANL